MKISVDFDNGILPNKYSKHADEKNLYNGYPITSFPFEVLDVPQEANYLCFTFVDHDAIPVCGFSWIHWTVANVDASFTKFPENYSQNDNYKKIQGTNSCASLIAKITDTKIIHRYTGPRPPDKDHNYTLTVYALKNAIDVDEGFYLNDLYYKIADKIIAQTSIYIMAKK